MPPMGKPGTLEGSEQLDQPPPSPALGPQGVNPGVPLPGEMGLGQAPLGSGQLPPEVLTGMMKTATQWAKDLEAFAQMAPDLAPDWAMVREALSVAMSKLLMAGAGPTAPTAPGPGFPGGGIDRGAQPLAPGVGA